MLLAAAIEHAGDAIDYYIFCDDDVVFTAGGFEAFERMLGETRPLVGFPLMPKAQQSATFDPALRTQRALAIDEQIVAVNRRLVGEVGVAPLVAEHDDVSWYVASLIFEYLCLTRYGALSHQYNEIVVENNGHIWETGGTLYHRGDTAQMLSTVEAALTAMTGRYDTAVIEQFDPARAANHAARIEHRSQLEHILVDGRASADLLAGQDKVCAGLKPALPCP
ncbi:hypothetical protein SAMN02799626_01863 [Caulobacter sp. UNC279MFTsu5.1]|nr:hypothetical protein SAMN02799626_01863 [Caulobacter sp. UNC279MFTsu5.1]